MAKIKTAELFWEDVLSGRTPMRDVRIEETVFTRM